MLNKGQVSALHLDQECERLQYADAAFSVLPVLEKFGVMEYEFNTLSNTAQDREWFGCLARNYVQMNELPHEMVARMQRCGDDQYGTRLKDFWASYLRHLASKVESLGQVDQERYQVQNLQ